MKFFRHVRIIFLCGAVCGLGCERAKSNATNEPDFVEPFTEASGAVGMDILSSSSLPDGSQELVISYARPEGTTTFRMKFHLDVPSNGISFGKGAVFHVDQSQPAPLLKALAKALEAKHTPLKTAHVSEMAFTAGGLGDHQKRQKDGGYQSGAGGTWTAMKLFFPGSHDEDAEVYFNFSAATKKAEFSIKDADYGDDLVADLAKVL